MNLNMNLIMDLNNLNIENIERWPQPVKILFLLIIFLLLLLLGYWFDTRAQLNELTQVEAKQNERMHSFEIKQQLAANLKTYQQQLKTIKQTFGAMLKQLPGTTEVPGLLEDISKTGIASGLTFKLFKPLPELKQDFYAELPIQIEVEGTYHELADFVSQVVGLDRIVTLHDFTIERLNAKQNEFAGAMPQTKPQAGPQGELMMNITAKTYRYTEGHRA